MGEFIPRYCIDHVIKGEVSANKTFCAHGLEMELSSARNRSPVNGVTYIQV